MRDSAVIVVGLLLIGGCNRVYVNPIRNAAEQQQARRLHDQGRQTTTSLSQPEASARHRTQDPSGDVRRRLHDRERLPEPDGANVVAEGGR